MRRYFSLLILTTLIGSASYAIKEHRDCLPDVLKWVTWSEARGTLKETLTRNAGYNDRIYQTFGEFPKNEWSQMVEKTIDDFDAYDKGFNGPHFKDWLKQNPGTHSPDARIGDYLSNRYDEYEKVFPHPKLKNTSQELVDATSAAMEKCGQDRVCNEKEIEMFLNKPKNAGIFRCLRSKEGAMRALATDLVLMNLGYLKSYKNNPEEGYSYDLMTTNLLFGPYMAEKTCRNTMGGTDRLGEKINFGQPITYKETYRRAGKSYLTYMKASLPWTGTYLTLNIGSELITGKKKLEDLSVTDIGKQVLTMTVWDGLYAVPIRSVLIKDPIYLRTLPRYRNKFKNRQQNYLADHEATLSPLMKKALKKSLVSESLFSPIDWGGRYLITWGNTDLFHVYQHLSDDVLGTHTRDKPKPDEENPEAPKITVTPKKTKSIRDPAIALPTPISDSIADPRM